MIDKWQIKAIYALGDSLGIVERGNREDNLHVLICGMTDKDSISALTYDEANKMISELKNRMKGLPAIPPPPRQKQNPTISGSVTEGQQRKVWQLMYELEKLDAVPSTATLGARLCGAIKRELHIDASPKNPFQWMDYRQGNRLIEILKKYISGSRQGSDRGDKHGHA